MSSGSSNNKPSHSGVGNITAELKFACGIVGWYRDDEGKMMVATYRDTKTKKIFLPKQEFELSKDRQGGEPNLAEFEDQVKRIPCFFERHGYLAHVSDYSSVDSAFLDTSTTSTTEGIIKTAWFLACIDKDAKVEISEHDRNIPRLDEPVDEVIKQLPKDEAKILEKAKERLLDDLTS